MVPSIFVMLMYLLIPYNNVVPFMSGICHLQSTDIVRVIFCLILLVVLLIAGSLRYWYERSKVDFLTSNSAVWNDDAVSGSLESAAFWVKGLPFVKSLSGYWKFFFSPTPADLPWNFHDTTFDDSAWERLPGKFLTCLVDPAVMSLFFLL